MKTNLDNRKKICLLLLMFLSVSIFPSIILPQYNTPSINLWLIRNGNSNLIFFEEKYNSEKSQDLKVAQNGINNWDKVIPKFDRDGNGISDQFEEKLSASKERISINNNEKNIKFLTQDQYSVIIQFPDDYNYTTAILIFKDNGGDIKYSYKHAINGFAGHINSDGLIDFYEQLKQNNIPFYIQEDGICKANLYYASRNMNLRPYTWNNLGYTGDNDSSIAILDTGIDDSHECFDNYSSVGKITNNKIVGWEDKVNGLSEPYDDNGHGSHCAGIAGGMGTPVLDGLGRTIATTSLTEDFRPWAYPDGTSGYLSLTRFNVTNSNPIEIECNYTDFTLDGDRIYGRAKLYYGGSQVDAVGNNLPGWEDNLTVPAPALGIYELRLYVTFDDNDGDYYVYYPFIRFRGEIHWSFNPNPYGCGNVWKGIAPKTHLVGVKILNHEGSGSSSQIINGIDWIIGEKTNLNITVMSLSIGLVNIFGNPTSDASVITSINNAVEKHGIVTVVSAGNSGPGGYNIGSPGDADNAITVAAMNYKDQITYYSSQGGVSIISNTTKPDITAPGGSSRHLPIYSADTGDTDAEGNFTTDHFANELAPAQGTSMAAPAVAGAASLLITAMGGGNQWNWNNGAKAKLVKSLLLMTATETYPLRRESYPESSPPLNRGGKDKHEGYGRINIDAAIEAWEKQLTIPANNITHIKPFLNTSSYNPAGKHSFARHVDLQKGQWYVFNLSVPTGVDYDLHLYNYTPTEWGEPDLIISSKSPIEGKNEIINYTAEYTGRYFLVAKAIGEPLLPAAAEKDDDNGGGEDEMTILEFLLSPLGLLIIGSCVAAVLIIITILIKKTVIKKRDDYKFSNIN